MAAGRPYSITQEMVDIASTVGHLPDVYAAHSIGIDPQTLRNYRSYAVDYTKLSKDEFDDLPKEKKLIFSLIQKLDQNRTKFVREQIKIITDDAKPGDRMKYLSKIDWRTFAPKVNVAELDQIEAVLRANFSKECVDKMILLMIEDQQKNG